MRTQSLTAAIALCGILSLPLQAAPKMVTAVSSAAQTFAFLYADPNVLLKRGIPLATAKATAATQLAPFGLKPCWTAGDLNSTGTVCGDPATGQMILETGAFYTYNPEVLLNVVPATVKLDRGVREMTISNFIAPSPVTGLGGDSVGRVAQVHFSVRTAQFGLLVDPGTFGSLNTIQLIVNDQALPPVTLTPNVVRFVAVEDSHGFTDVTLIASGVTQSFVASGFAFLPLANF